MYNDAKNNKDLVNTAFRCVEVQLQNIYIYIVPHENGIYTLCMRIKAYRSTSYRQHGFPYKLRK